MRVTKCIIGLIIANALAVFLTRPWNLGDLGFLSTSMHVAIISGSNPSG